MKLIAKKPCSFGGEQFYIGDEIPAEIVLDPKAQEKRGVLVCADAQGQPQPEAQAEVAQAETMTILVKTDEGEMSLEISKDGMQDIFSALTSNNAAAAEKIVKQMTDGDALVLLLMADSRKSIKAAAEARAKAIEEAGEQ